MRTWWQRLVVWLARHPIAELEARVAIEHVKGYDRGRETGYEQGVGDGYALGWNAATARMRNEMEAARAELAWIRALHMPPARGAAERIH